MAALSGVQVLRCFATLSHVIFLSIRQGSCYLQFKL